MSTEVPIASQGASETIAAKSKMSKDAESACGRTVSILVRKPSEAGRIANPYH